MTKLLLEIISITKSNNINLPLKVFNKFYILDDNNKWIILDDENFKLFIIKIQRGLLNIFTIWNKSIEHKLCDDSFSLIYFANMKKVLGQSRVDLNIDNSLSIKNKLQKKLSENPNDMFN